jgi:hypothetical protein
MEAVKTRGVAWVACGLLLGASVAPPPLLATVPSSETAPQPPKAPSACVERLYHDAQRQYHRGNYAGDVPEPGRAAVDDAGRTSAPRANTDIRFRDREGYQR